MPAKSRLTWHISRLRLTADGLGWVATGWKGERVSVIELPSSSAETPEELWIARIEARFEQNAQDPCAADYADALAAGASKRST